MTALVIPFVRAPHVADARAELVKWSHAVIRSMHRQCDEDVLTACYYLRQFGGEADKLLADQVQRELRLRDETSARIALRHLPRWPAVLAGAVAFTGFWWGVVALVMGVGG